jgi:hypothetical protein
VELTAGEGDGLTAAQRGPIVRRESYVQSTAAPMPPTSGSDSAVAASGAHAASSSDEASRPEPVGDVRELVLAADQLHGRPPLARRPAPAVVTSVTLANDRQSQSVTTSNPPSQPACRSTLKRTVHTPAGPVPVTDDAPVNTVPSGLVRRSPSRNPYPE